MSFQTASTLAASPIVEVTRQTNTVETATTDWKDPYRDALHRGTRFAPHPAGRDVD